MTPTYTQIVYAYFASQVEIEDYLTTHPADRTEDAKTFFARVEPASFHYLSWFKNPKSDHNTYTDYADLACRRPVPTLDEIHDGAILPHDPEENLIKLSWNTSEIVHTVDISNAPAFNQTVVNLAIELLDLMDGENSGEFWVNNSVRIKTIKHVLMSWAKGEDVIMSRLCYA